MIDTYLPVANKGNDYLIDREVQRTTNFTGIWGVNEQDRGIQESMRSLPGSPGIADRRAEHLVGSDMPAVAARRTFTKLIRDLDAGIEPACLGHSVSYCVRAISKVSEIADFDEFMASFGEMSHGSIWENGSPRGRPQEQRT